MRSISAQSMRKKKRKRRAFKYETKSPILSISVIKRAFYVEYKIRIK